MSTLTYAGAPVEVDAEGFLQKPEQWTQEMAAEIAREHGMPIYRVVAGAPFTGSPSTT